MQVKHFTVVKRKQGEKSKICGNHNCISIISGNYTRACSATRCLKLRAYKDIYAQTARHLNFVMNIRNYNEQLLAIIQ